MNIFLYDVYLDKYKKKVRKMEENLNQLNLQGKILYLNSIKNINEALLNEINSGANTVVVVGNNNTLNNIINILANIGQKIPISIIPIGPNNSIAESMGILDEKEACFILSSRRIENINLVSANNHFFVKDAYIETKKTSLNIDDSYKMIFSKNGDCYIFNIPPKEEYLNKQKIDIKEDDLHLYVKIGSKSKTYLRVKKVDIDNPEEKVIIDDSIKIDTPVKIKPSEKTISLIVGKNRTF